MEKITMNGILLLTLTSKMDWVNRVPRCLPDKVIKAEQWVWIDSNGYCLAIGEDFEAAVKMASYPVKVYRLIRVVEALEKESATQN